MTRSLIPGLVALALLVAPPATAEKNRAQFKDGFYISLGLGYASVNGTRGVEMILADECVNHNWNEDTFLWLDKNGCAPAPGNSPDSKTENFGEIVRTDYGDGAALQIRMGYTIRGLVTPELLIAGNGDLGTLKNGMGHIGVRLRYHPLEHKRPGADRNFDLGLYYGYGFSMGGYNHQKPETSAGQMYDYDSGKGWIGTFHTTGMTFEYAATDKVAYGLDLGWILPQYSGWIVNWGDDVVSAPKSPPPTTVFAPVVYLSFRP